ncbi:hypothetical protein IQ255_02195 [Pleurocapsales cyanobacterium LEGE 10410]|nr:hypothetical protein [Pleurocapsales cyanobacterium LEGE 10410]
MPQIKYRIDQAENQRWGIYQGERLLATIGSYEACQSIWKYLQQELSYTENVKSRLSYRNAINKNLIVDSSRRVG